MQLLKFLRIQNSRFCGYKQWCTALCKNVCPEVWGENGETITYDWFDNEGPTMDATVEYYNAKVVVP